MRSDAQHRSEPEGPALRHLTDTRRGDGRLMVLAVCGAVAVAFADSSIVVLALPALYSALGTSIVGVSWVITSYNLAVVVVACLLVSLMRRLDVAKLTTTGLALFCAGSVGCALSGSLLVLIVCRCAQGAGAAMLLAGTLALLSALCHSRARGVALWSTAGTVGAALAPALGGILTELFDWRAIFVFQAPIALAALVANSRSPVELEAGDGTRLRVASNLGLGLIFGALVGALFLAVLLVITVWGLSPIAGAAAVSALPAFALAAGRLRRELSLRAAGAAGALLLAGGLIALALLPAVSPALLAGALGLCGAGMGLAIPVLTDAAVGPDEQLVHAGTVTIGARHAGLVVGLLLVAPLLSHDLQRGAHDALLGGAKVLLSANAPIRQQVPIALDLRGAIDHAPRGTVPDLAAPFDKQGAAHDARLRRVRDSLVAAVTDAIARSFRTALALCAALAALVLVPIAIIRPRGPE
ncbi:MAG TPA: MFS transporter [Solirubrobacteraceae bacterium]|nr:MFS transporter [Solirubrobacteraceae bacterium]